MLTKLIQVFFLGVITNFGMLGFLYTLIGYRITIEYYQNSIILIVGILGIGILILIKAKLLEYIYKKNFIKVALIGYSAMVYAILSINFMNIIKLVYNLLTFKDRILETRYFGIRYHYTLEELMSMIPVFYKEMAGVARIFSEKEKLQVLNKATSTAELRRNVKEFLLREQEGLNINFIEYIINFAITHPYIIGTLCGIAALIIGVNIYKHYNNVAHWQNANTNIRDLATQLRETPTGIQQVRENIRRSLNVLDVQDNNIRLINKIMGTLISSLGTFFQVGIDINRDGTKVRIEPKHLTTLISRLMDCFKRVEIITNYTKTKRDQKKECFEPFTGEGYKLGGEKEKSNLLGEE